MTLVAVVLSARQLSDLCNFLPYAFFLNAFPGVVKALPPYTNVYWSLATEVLFY